MIPKTNTGEVPNIDGETNSDEDIRNNFRPMTPLAASSTIVNLLLATGPFSYPYGYVNLGPFLSCIIIGITCILAYVSATFMLEAISVAQSR